MNYWCFFALIQKWNSESSPQHVQLKQAAILKDILPSSMDVNVISYRECNETACANSIAREERIAIEVNLKAIAPKNMAVKRFE